MKKLALSTMLLFSFGIGTSFAQDLTKPKSGNAIRLKDYSVTIAQGEDLDLEMWVVKSKKFKLKLDEPKASGKTGVAFDFKSKSDDPITYDMKIHVNASTPVGSYLYVLKVPGNGRNTVKSATLMVKVVESEL